MYQNVKWVRLTPDRPGRGGTKTGIHTFQQQPINDTRSLIGGFVYQGYWKRDVDSALYPNPQHTNAGDQFPWSVHGYVYPSLTDPSAQPGLTVLGHQGHAGGTFHVWDYTHGGVRVNRPGSNYRGVFNTVNQRCFFADGMGEGYIFDDRTPAIHAQPNQRLGIGTPGQALRITNALPLSAAAPSSAVIPNLTSYGFAYIFNTRGVAASILHTPNPSSPLGTLLITDTITVSLAEPAYAAITGALPSPGLPLTPPISSNTASAITPPFAIGGDTITCVNGSSIVMRSGAWPTGRGKVAGLAINFNGFSAVLGPTDKDTAPDQLDINGNVVVLGANQAVIYSVYTGPTYTGAFTITGCEVALGGSAGSTNTLSISNSAAPTLGYSQSTASSMVPVLVSAIRNNNVWFAEANVGGSAGGGVGKSTLAGAITEYTAGVTGQPIKCALGPTGDVWFTESNHLIARVSQTGNVTEFPTPTNPSDPVDICLGPDGNMWFTESAAAVNSIARITADGTITEFPIPTAGALPNGICLGPDGNLWFTENFTDKIGKINVSGGVTEYPLAGGSNPTGICAGPDGNIWFTNTTAGSIGQITPDGVITTFTVGITPASSPNGICAGPDGNVWFAENAIAVSKVAKITPTGVVTEYAPTTGNSRPLGITAAPDGNLWFTEFAVNKIAKVTTAGVFTEYALPAGTAPNGICAGAVMKNLGNISLSGPGITAIHAGPTYAYAWYDPETGHMSNISPLTTIAAPPTVPPAALVNSYQNMTPYFRIDPGYIAYPEPTVDGVRFSHIMFFRTLSEGGGSTLYPIGSLMPFVGKVHPGAVSTRGSWNPLPLQGWMGLPNIYTDAPPAGTPPNYWYDFSSDTDLILSGGFRAPQFTNEKPMALLRGGITQPAYPYAEAYWDRRTWLASTQEPDKILFSCDEAQCPLGVPEESFPPTNFLRLPAVDGRVTGMRTVGDLLLVTTERWAYIIAGNNESNYRLMKVSASMPGVGTFQMDEFPTLSGAEGEPTTLFYLGKDRKVYQWTMGAQVVPISMQIQDQIDSMLTFPPGPVSSAYNFSSVHCVSAWGRRLVVVAIYQFNPGTYLTTFIYDIDNQIWSTTGRTDGTGGTFSNIAPMTTVYGLDPPVNEIYLIPSPTAGGDIICRSWLREDVVSASIPFQMETFPLNFDGKKTRKRIVAANLHATTGTYSLSYRVNEGLGFITVPFGPYPDPLDSIYAPSFSPVDPNAEDVVVMQAQFDATNGAPIIGYRTIFRVERTDIAAAKVYALDIGYVDEEIAGEGDV